MAQLPRCRDLSVSLHPFLSLAAASDFLSDTAGVSGGVSARNGVLSASSAWRNQCL